MYQTEAMVSLTRYHHGSSDRSNYYPIHLKGRMRGQQLKVVSQYDGASLPETRELLCPNLFLKLISSSFYHFAVFLQYNRYFPWFFNDLGFQKYRVFVQGKGGRKSNACSLRFHAPHAPPATAVHGLSYSLKRSKFSVWQLLCAIWMNSL